MFVLKRFRIILPNIIISSYRSQYKNHILVPSYMLCGRSVHQLTVDNVILDNKVLKSSDNSQVELLLKHLSPEDSQKLKVLKLEFDVLYSTGVQVPDTMEGANWLHVLQNCPSPHSRKRYYSYLFRIEKKEINRKLKAQENIKMSTEKYLKIKELADTGLTGTFKNTFLLKLNSATVNKHQNNNIAHSMQFGPHLVLDASFEDQMTQRENQNLSLQLQMSHGVNKDDPHPFHFHFCNLKSSSELYRLLKKSMDPDRLMMSHTNQHYTKIYPKERLVYLSPNAPKILTKFNHDDIYIIGCVVDKNVELPLSLARAKRDEIRTYRLPIDENIKWIAGSKALTLNQVVEILLSVKSNNNNWYAAFVKSLPKRKAFDYEQGRYIGLKNK